MEEKKKKRKKRVGPGSVEEVIYGCALLDLALLVC
jgi:hypothetical protein